MVVISSAAGAKVAFLCAVVVAAACGDPLSALSELDCVTGCQLPNALGKCVEDCVVDQCYFGFKDCNGIAKDGCEVDVASDPSHCGACGNACEPCVKGSCRTIETLAARPHEQAVISIVGGLTLLGSEVYWVDRYALFSSGGDGEVLAVQKGGGELRHVAPRGQRLTALTAGAGSLYAVGVDGRLDEKGRHVIEAHRILAIDPASGQMRELTRRDGEPSTDLVSEGEHVYWSFLVRAHAENLPLPGGSVMRVPSAGGAAEALKVWEIAGSATALAAHQGTIYWAGVTWTEARVDFELSTWSLANPTVTNIPIDRRSLCLIADVGEIYALEWNPGGGAAEARLSRRPLAGGEPQVLWESRGYVHDCTADAHRVYVVNQFDGTVVQIEKTSGAATVVAGAQHLLSGLTTDGQFVYWATADEIVRVAVE
jgi:hypothetical protein